MPAEPADRPSLDPDDIAGRSFTKVRKGYEVDEVRAYLVGLGSQVRDAQRELDAANRRLEELERRTAEPDALEDLDEAQLTQLLGEETVRILDTARSSAAELKAKAESAAEEVTSSAATEAGTVREAADQYAQGVRSEADAYAAEVRERADAEVAELRDTAATETAALRAAAETLLADRTAEADEAAQAIRSEAEAYATDVRAAADTYVAEQHTAADIYASNTRDEADAVKAAAEAAAAERATAAEQEAEAVVDEAREQGRAMVTEARTYRERVIADLADRRRSARAQLDELAATRDALSVTLTDVAARVEASHRAVAATEIDPGALGDVAADRAALAASDLSPADDEPDRADEPDPDASSEAPDGPDADPEPEHASDPDPDPEPEPEAEVESEPELEPEAELESEPELEPEPEPEPEPDPDPETAASPDPVDAVFAQLKAQQADPAAGGPGEPEDEPPSEDEPEVVEVVEASEADVGAEPGGNEDQDVLDRRDRTTDDLERQLARRLKRVLSDEQNEALDRLRTSKGQPDAEVVLLSPGEHLGRYHEAALEDLVHAERAGAAFFGDAPAAAADVSDVAGEFAADLVRQLRGRLEAAFGDGGDEHEVSERIRSCYREWKTQRIAEAAKHYVLVAFNRGVAEAAADGSSARWVVDDGETPSPDCEDNALAGAVAKGDEFPTGDLHPPAYPGCRCLAVPT